METEHHGSAEPALRQEILRAALRTYENHAASELQIASDTGDTPAWAHYGTHLTAVRQWLREVYVEQGVLSETILSVLQRMVEADAVDQEVVASWLLARPDFTSEAQHAARLWLTDPDAPDAAARARVWDRIERARAEERESPSW